MFAQAKHNNIINLNAAEIHNKENIV